MSAHSQLDITDLVIDETYELHVERTYSGATVSVLAYLNEVHPDRAVFFIDGDEPYYDDVWHGGTCVDVAASDVGVVVHTYSPEFEDERRERYYDEIASGRDPLGWADPHETVRLSGSPLLAIIDRTYWAQGERTPGAGWVLAVFERIALIDEATIFGWPMVGESTEARSRSGQRVGALVRPIQGPLAERQCLSFADHDDLRVANDILLEEIHHEQSEIRRIKAAIIERGAAQIEILDRYGLRGVVDASSVLTSEGAESGGGWFNYSPTATAPLAEPGIRISLRDLARFAAAIAETPEVAEKLIRETALDALGKI